MQSSNAKPVPVATHFWKCGVTFHEGKNILNKRDNVKYKCKKTHVAAPENEAGIGVDAGDYWTRLMVPSAVPRLNTQLEPPTAPHWTMGCTYKRGKVILSTRDGVTYQCLKKHVAAPDNEAGNGANAEKHWERVPME